MFNPMIIQSTIDYFRNAIQETKEICHTRCCEEDCEDCVLGRELHHQRYAVLCMKKLAEEGGAE